MAEAATMLTEDTGTAPEGEEQTTDSAEGTAPEEKAAPDADQGDSGKETSDDASGDEGGEESAEVPEKYELEFPEGVAPDEALLESVTPIFKEMGLTNEQAQKLTDAYAARHQAVMEAHAAQVTEWANETKADKEIGGAKFEESVGIARTAIKQFADDTVLEQLNATGLGNHPAVVKMFYRIGKALGEDQHVPPGSASHQRKSPVELFYPNHSQE
jgi:hypothetical protein